MVAAVLGAPEHPRQGLADARVVGGEVDLGAAAGDRHQGQLVLGIEGVEQAVGRVQRVAPGGGADVALVDHEDDHAAAVDALVRADEAVGRGRGSGLRRLLRGHRHEIGGDDGPRRAVDGQLEVLDPEAAHGTALLVHDVDVHRDHVDVRGEDGPLGRVLPGRVLGGAHVDAAQDGQPAGHGEHGSPHGRSSAPGPRATARYPCRARTRRPGPSTSRRIRRHEPSWRALAGE